jgi:hypothetical protein
MFHEQHLNQNQNRPSQAQLSSCCLGAVLYESTNAGSRGIIFPPPLPFEARPKVMTTQQLARDRHYSLAPTVRSAAAAPPSLRSTKGAASSPVHFSDVLVSGVKDSTAKSRS